MAVNSKCKWCGRGFREKPYDIHSTTYTCKRAKCEKKQGIYKKPE